MIVLDSSVLIAALSKKDAKHELAKALMAEIGEGKWGLPLIPDWVAIEVANFVLRRFGRAQAIRIVGGMARPDAGRIVPCSPYLRRALEIFSSPAGRTLGLADAGIVAMAEEMDVTDIATFDAGFRAVARLNIVDHARSAS